MARPPRDQEGALAKAVDAAREAKDVDELRAAQAVLLPLLGVSLETTATAVGRDRFWVSRTRNRVLKGLPQPGPRGGRRRAYLSDKDELDLVIRAIESSSEGQWADQPTLKQALRDLLDSKLPTYVADSTVTDMMSRAAHQLVPGADSTELRAVAYILRELWFRGRQIREVIQKIGDR